MATEVRILRVRLSYSQMITTCVKVFVLDLIAVLEKSNIEKIL